MQYVIDLKNVSLVDRASVGGKNASTGEMIQHLANKGIDVPGGFAVTVAAFNQFLTYHSLDKKIEEELKKTNINKIASLKTRSANIRRFILKTPFSNEFIRAVASAYHQLPHASVAVRSSATAEDSADASFAGQQETFLNISGLQNVLQAIKLVYASLYTERAMSYRAHHNIDTQSMGISVGIQSMVRSDKAVSGVIFTLDTESGFDQVIMITASYGLGELLVQGKVNPDEFIVYKPALQKNKTVLLQKKLGKKDYKMIYTSKNNPKKSVKVVPVSVKEQNKFCLTDKEIETLAHYALMIENHYKLPMDIEWAKDGISQKIYIVQARPETVAHRKKSSQSIEHYSIQDKGKILTSGYSIGQRIGQGRANVILNLKSLRNFQPGNVLVTDMTDPDWEPIMKNASAIVTNRGGRTCHAAIVARELGIPAVVGCENATKVIKNKQNITVSCAEGQIGYVYDKELKIHIDKIAIDKMPDLPLSLCLNVGNPEMAFANQFFPNQGVGLARLEFIINAIGLHPNAALQFKKLPQSLRNKINKKISGYKNPLEFYIEKCREGIAMIAAAFYPKPVIFRFSDFKSNEYANLLGGDLFEPNEENPMIGFRGASRYHHSSFLESFKLECEAFVRVRQHNQLINAHVMVPFVRTVEELCGVIRLIESCGLKRGEDGLKIYMMCEVPSNAILAEEFLKHVDGFSIGSNDLTQLILGLDRDSNLVAPLFDERNSAVKIMLKKVIAECNKQNKYIGICGQAPSDYPEFAEWLMQEGIQNISLNADTIVKTWQMLAKKNVKSVR